MWGFNLGSCCLRWLYLFICIFRLKPKWLWQMAAPPSAWFCWRYLPVRREFFFLTVSKQSDCVYVELNWIEPKVTSWQPIEQQMQSKVWLNYYYYDDYYSQRKKSLSKTILQSSCEHWRGGWLLQSFLLSTVAGKGSLLAMSLLGWVTKSTVMKNIHSVSSLAKVNVPS